MCPLIDCGEYLATNHATKYATNIFLTGSLAHHASPQHLGYEIQAIEDNVCP